VGGGHQHTIHKRSMFPAIWSTRPDGTHASRSLVDVTTPHRFANLAAKIVGALAALAPVAGEAGRHQFVLVVLAPSVKRRPVVHFPPAQSILHRSQVLVAVVAVSGGRVVDGTNDLGRKLAPLPPCFPALSPSVFRTTRPARPHCSSCVLGVRYRQEFGRWGCLSFLPTNAQKNDLLSGRTWT
jgi:hypothetical protein